MLRGPAGLKPPMSTRAAACGGAAVVTTVGTPQTSFRVRSPVGPQGNTARSTANDWAGNNAVNFNFMHEKHECAFGRGFAGVNAGQSAAVRDVQTRRVPGGYLACILTASNATNPACTVAVQKCCNYNAYSLF